MLLQDMILKDLLQLLVTGFQNRKNVAVWDFGLFFVSIPELKLPGPDSTHWEFQARTLILCEKLGQEQAVFLRAIPHCSVHRHLPKPLAHFFDFFSFFTCNGLIFTELLNWSKILAFLSFGAAFSFGTGALPLGVLSEAFFFHETFAVLTLVRTVQLMTRWGKGLQGD